MPKSPMDRALVPRSKPRRLNVPSTSDGLPDLQDIAEQICATAYIDGKTDIDGKTGGVFAAAYNVLAHRLSISDQTLNLALAAGISRGWLRQGSNQIELTASGIYVGKLTLKLPT